VQIVGVFILNPTSTCGIGFGEVTGFVGVVLNPI